MKYYQADHDLLDYLSSIGDSEYYTKITEPLIFIIRDLKGEELYGEINGSQYLFNVTMYYKVKSEMTILDDFLAEMGTRKPVYFKGIVLAEQLYSNPYVRIVKDVDFFVPNASPDTVISEMVSHGYELMDNGRVDSQHFVLWKNKTMFELHKQLFYSKINIDESAFFETEYSKELGFTTFNKTLTFLNYLYHLYMDSCLHLGFWKDAPQNVAIRVPGFVYRAYELSLFYEKYNREIDMDFIRYDIDKQIINDSFYAMIDGIKTIFRDFPLSPPILY